MELGIHILLIVHPTKLETENRPIRLNDLKGSSELKQIPDNVLSIWRPRGEDDSKNPSTEIVLYILKARDDAGDEGNVILSSWNQQGPQGPQGVQGPAGQPGALFTLVDDSGQTLGQIVALNPQILYDEVAKKFHSLIFGPAFFYLDDQCAGQVLQRVAFFTVGGSNLHPVYPYLYIPGIPPQGWAIQNGPNAYYTPTETVISVDQWTKIYQRNIFSDPNECLLQSAPEDYYVMEQVQMGFNMPISYPVHVIVTK